jgi:hypothetical protein
MYSVEKFEISGHEGLKVPNSYIKHKENHKHLAILLPGMGYTCQMPLLHYTTGLLLDKKPTFLGSNIIIVKMKGFKISLTQKRKNGS